jgi:mannose-1-phosphate guanylyltransferase
MSSPLTKALLMAGGLGTRLRPVTDRTPKCLVPIGGRPLLDYWIDLLEAARIRQALINTHHLPDQVREHITRVNLSSNVQLQEAYEPVLLGSAGTVHANRDFIRTGETCLIVYTDNLSTVDLTAMLEFHHAHDDPVTMMLFRSSHPERCGIAEVDQDCRITGFVEKPKHPVGNYANGGLYAVTADGFHEMADMDRFDLAAEVLPRFVGRMRGWIWDGYHRDTGTLDALEQANRDVRSGCPEARGVAV